LTSDKSGASFLSELDTKAMANQPNPDVLRGTLDLLILKTLTLEEMHGWGIAQRIQQFSRGILEVNQGSLYPALQRLEQKGWIRSEWRTSDANRRAKYYDLTATGRRALGAETANWRRYVGAVDLILET
jgi:transcriptional regulator